MATQDVKETGLGDIVNHMANLIDGPGRTRRAEQRVDGNLYRIVQGCARARELHRKKVTKVAEVSNACGGEI
jgi:hypothetical protein